MTTAGCDLECIRSQNNEFQVLQNIYLDEFHPLKESFPHKFDILCYPYRHPSSVRSLLNTTTNKTAAEYQIKLSFEFTPNYPKSPLKYDIEPVTGLTRDNILSITNKVEAIIYDNRDRPIVYDIVEEIREWVQEYLVEGKAYEDDDQIEDYRNKKEEHFERPKFAAFTPVTTESFLAWKKEFDM